MAESPSDCADTGATARISASLAVGPLGKWFCPRELRVSRCQWLLA